MTAAGARREPRVAVVMMTLNQREKTLRCLESLLSIEEPEFDVLLWDNGSTDGTTEAVVARFPGVLVHRHPENLGVAPGRNAAADLAIRTFRPTHLLFLDNDMHLEPDFVSELLEPFAGDERVGQTQAKLRFLYDRRILNDGGGCRIRFWLGETEPYGKGEVDRGQYDTPRRCVAGGGAMMVRTDVFRELGGFDTIFGHLGPDDLDFSLRLSKAGYYALFVPTAVAYHEVSHTFGRDYDEGYARLKARNWFVFLRRHAPLHQRVGFFLIGAPYLVLRMLVREGRKGNLGALRGVGRGLLDHVRAFGRRRGR